MDGYAVTVETRAPRGERVEEVENRLDALMGELASHHGVCGGHPTSWEATVSVDAVDADTATRQGREIVGTGAARAGLPDWPVARVETVREDVLDEELARPNAPDLVSGPEAAAVLGVNRQRVHQLAHTHADFPEPLYRLGVGSLWTREAIEDFRRRWERRPGRPPIAS